MGRYWLSVTGDEVEFRTVIPGGTSATLTGHRELILEHAARPVKSCGDALLASAASAARPGPVIGVILSGMLSDGSEGIRAIKRSGGRVLAQDPVTARAASMPASVLAAGCVDFALPPHRLAPALVALTMAPAAQASWPSPPRTGPPWEQAEPRPWPLG